MSDRPALSRRRLLELLSASGIGGLAGCGGQTVTPSKTVTAVNTPSETTDLTQTETPKGTGSPPESPTENREVELSWTQLPGPVGGPVTYISVSEADPEWIYAAGRTAGIFTSKDGGSSWIQGFSGQHHRSRIWASPYEPQTAFTPREWTDNGGRKWHHPEWSSRERYAPIAAPAISLGGPTVARVYNMEWDPFREQTIYASTPEGLYLTSNGGESWERKPIDGIENPPAFRGWDFAVHPTDAGLIVVGMRNKIATSRDRGDTWTILDLGENHPQTSNRFIRGVEFSGTSTDEIVLTIEGKGVFKLEGDTFTELSQELPDLVFTKLDLPLSPSADRRRLYFIAGRSSEMYPVRQWWDDRTLFVFDTTSNRLDTVKTPVKPNAITTHPNDNSVLFIGGDSWIHKSQDNGRSWEALSNGFVDHYLATVAVNPSHPGTVYPGSICSTGLSVSYDQGKTYEWKRSGLGPWHQGPFGEHYLMQIGAAGERAYATTSAGLLISEDNGANWRLLENEFSGEGGCNGPNKHLHGLAVHPESPETVYVGTGRGGGCGGYDVFDGAKIWKSDDGGDTWTERTSGFATDADTTVQDIVINPHRPSVVYAATNAADYIATGSEGGEGVGIYRSNDGGRSWSKLPTPFANVHSVTVDAGEAETVYASVRTPERWNMEGSAHRSEDGGQSWERMLDTETHALLAHPSKPGLLFAGAMKYPDYWDVLVSDDAGETWSEGDLRIRTTFNPAGPERSYDATELHSDYWGNSNGQIMWFALDEVNSDLYAATNGVGLWRTDTSRLEG